LAENIFLTVNYLPLLLAAVVVLYVASGDLKVFVFFRFIGSWSIVVFGTRLSLRGCWGSFLPCALDCGGSTSVSFGAGARNEVQYKSINNVQ